MGETTLKIFALHYNIRSTGVANLKVKQKMVTPFHVIMFGILLIMSSTSQALVITLWKKDLAKHNL